ncbi:MAG: hypothetical protein ACERLG_10420 [Sedimentibacter sp.]
MIKKTVDNHQFFEIQDDISSTIFYGCNQEWYKKKWQRMSGCGPTAASNIVLYNRKNMKTSKSDAVILMEEMWKNITPTCRGVNTTKIFYDGFMSYVESKKEKATFDFIDIPKDKNMRPVFLKLLDFINTSLDNNIPLAFLNLCNGEEKCLDKWHWVTIVTLEYEESGNIAVIEILDQGTKKIIDLLLWYNTTTLGGGFVSFSLS